MNNRYIAAIMISLVATAANAQVERGVMTVTGAEMH